MADNTQAVKVAVARYRAMRALSLIRAVGLLIIGVVGFFLAGSGKIFEVTGQAPSGWLYENLGQQGVMVGGVILFSLLTLAAGIWAYRLYRDMTSGYKEYEKQVRQDLTNGVEVHY